MEFNELDKCLYIMGYQRHGNKTESIDVLLDESLDILNIYVYPFKKELNKNFLSKDSLEAKIYLLKHYIFEFFEIQSLFESHREILSTGSLRNFTSIDYEHTNEENKTRILTKFENYAVNSHILFDMLFSELQIVGFKYDIDFLKICEQLSFSIDYFDSSESWMFKDSKNQSLKNEIDHLKASEVALRHWYLVEGKIEKSPDFSNDVGKKYQNIANRTNVAKAWSDIITKKLKITPVMLKRIMDSLSDYPTVQKLIVNDLEKLLE
ncbi:hypothetical protein [Pedobacter frigiditerrae]|uniref:hypothetical protein n=1 Tax=Pedobacter frigiditerrae TaxID=2530452 RepID=UPI00292FBCDF|nr:hypothetical protein [Pedobacter frigiditerrae]